MRARTRAVGQSTFSSIADHTALSLSVMRPPAGGPCRCALSSVYYLIRAGPRPADACSPSSRSQPIVRLTRQATMPLAGHAHADRTRTPAPPPDPRVPRPRPHPRSSLRARDTAYPNASIHAERAALPPNTDSTWQQRRSGQSTPKRHSILTTVSNCVPFRPVDSIPRLTL
jgi:hypothetical protein